jgi:hypothetical protein
VDGLESLGRRLGSRPRIASRLAISDRDLRIIERALEKIRGARIDFGDAVRALRESVEEEIPDGRIFLLGTTEHGPILGSIISGVGIVDSPAGIQLVRARQGEMPSTLGGFLR